MRGLAGFWRVNEKRSYFQACNFFSIDAQGTENECVLPVHRCRTLQKTSAMQLQKVRASATSVATFSLSGKCEAPQSIIAICEGA